MIRINKVAFDKLFDTENISATKFANNLGVSRSQVWRVLNGKCNPGEEFIAKFKAAYPTKLFEEYFFIDNVTSK